MASMARALLAGMALASASPASANESNPTTPTRGACEALSKELLGQTALRPVGKIKPPKLVYSTKPEYPAIPSGTVGSGTWVGEAVIGPDGRVRGVSVLRDLRFTPSFPAFSKAISDAVSQWRYTPTVVDGKPVPVCMTLSVNIHWR